jgi:D-hydroxyproline dehydrogenase subunit alpha
MSPTSSEPGTEVVVPAVVVGAGPAGMAAAVALAEAGVAVHVLDTYPQPGGQYHRTSAVGLDRRTDTGPPPGSGLGGRRLDTAHPDPTVAAYLRHLDLGTVSHHPGTTVWTATVDDTAARPATDIAVPPTTDTAAPPAPAAAASAGRGDGRARFVLELTGVGGGQPPAATLRAEVVVLATGATDRVLPFPGWDLPGVVTVGAAQALLKGQGVRVGERVVVGGSGPFLLPVAAALAAAGTQVVTVAEAQPAAALARSTSIATAGPLVWQHRRTLLEGAGYAAVLARHRVPVATATAVTAVHGDGRVEEVVLSRLAADWSPVPGSERTVAADAAAVSFGFVPQVGLAALLGCRLVADPVWGDPVAEVDAHQTTSVAGVFAAGEVAGVAGAPAAAAEGALAGLAAAYHLGAIDLAALRGRGQCSRRERASRRAFAAVLGRAYARGDGWVRWLEDDTLVCRCEEVDHDSVRAAIDDQGASDLRSVKLVTRCGMGRCQGRMCGDAVATLVAHHTDTPPTDLGALSTPTVLTPVPLRRLAALHQATADTHDASGATHDASGATHHAADHPDREPS